MKISRASRVWLWFGIFGLGLIAAAKARRRDVRDTSHPGRPQPWYLNFLVALFARINRFIAWHQLPAHIAVLNLIAFRHTLRQANLYDTSAPNSLDESGPFSPDFLAYRNSDGTWNDLRHPGMGATGQRFGRNMPNSDECEPEILQPSPRLISECLLKRNTFIPAESLNLLAAAWVQFQVHDWFSHGVDQKSYFEIPLADEGPNRALETDPWRRCADPGPEGEPESTMRIPRTAPDPKSDGPGYPPTYVNAVSHWWDASAIYGEDNTTTTKLRSPEGGKLKLDNEELPIDPKTRTVRTGHVENWWIGLALLHTLFAREHNAVCDRLKAEYPGWSDERLFQTARLIIGALTAKIHTLEWTPAILSHPALKLAMNVNWWGLATEHLHKLCGRISSSEVLSGIPGSPTDHHGVPFALTEEFVSVYRLHPLLPDRILVRSLKDGSVLKDLSLLDVAFQNALYVVDHGEPIGGRERVLMQDVFYSFGISHPGAITLHNYPNTLRDIRIPVNGADTTAGTRRLDLAATDIMRDRERGVPRYNLFRTLLGLQPIPSFEAMTSNREWASELRQVYGHVDRVDLMVGLFVEEKPKGFAFSDTAFRIFILMASRRLKSDRFFTADYGPRIYTKAGMDWINNNNMTSVLIRHYPSLERCLSGIGNAFAPWRDLHTGRLRRD